MRPSASRPRTRTNGAFSLVELLLVAAIIAIMMSVLAFSLNRARGPAVQVAAGQVASGFQLARQIAIGKNTKTRFVIATKMGDGLPAQPFRYWAVISSNKSVPNLWLMEKDWEPLPEGVVFLNLATRDYNTTEWDPIPQAVIGNPEAFANTVYGHTGANKEYQGFSSAGAARISYPDAPDKPVHNLPAETPYVGYKPSGAAFFSASGGVGQRRLAGLRVAEGSVDSSGRIVLQTDRNAAYIETDTGVGKVVVRSRESYRE